MISKPAIMRRGEYKCMILDMYWKLRDQQLTTVLYIYRLLYQNLVGTTKQNSTIDGHTKTKKQCKHHTKDSHQITREENKRGREEKGPMKTNPKQFKKWQ